MKTILSWRRFHYLTRVIILLIMGGLIAGLAGCFGYNPPTPSQNLEIQTWYDLDAVRNNLAGNHTLMNHLDSTTAGYEELASPAANGGKGWRPIGPTCFVCFTGSFDGQGYEIRDLYINRPDECTAGLFGFVNLGGRIKDVGVVNANVTGSLDADYHGYDSAGSLVGVNLGTVNNSYSTGSVTCEWAVGGLVGDSAGTVSNSYYSGDVTGNAWAGGLVGLNEGVVSNSYYAYDEVLINGANVITVGALFGEDFDQWLANDKFLDVNERLSQENGYYVVSNATDFEELLAFGQNASLKFRLENDLDLATEPNFYIPYLAGEFEGNGHQISNLSFNFGFVVHVGLFGYLAPSGKVTQVGIENVNITAAKYVGGLVGSNPQGIVNNCYATGSITGNESIGGLVGRSHGTMSNSYFSGSVIGDEYVGGLVGEAMSGSTLSNCYSTGSVTGTWGTGGVVGINLGTVSNSYSTGNVTGASWVGGLVGYNLRGTVSNSFWDTETSGQATSSGGTGKNTTAMQDINTFSGAGWDIITVANLSTRDPSYIWNIVDYETYPFLSWQPIS